MLLWVTRSESVMICFSSSTIIQSNQDSECTRRSDGIKNLGFVACSTVFTPGQHASHTLLQKNPTPLMLSNIIDWIFSCSTCTHTRKDSPASSDPSFYDKGNKGRRLIGFMVSIIRKQGPLFLRERLSSSRDAALKHPWEGTAPYRGPCSSRRRYR